MMVLKQASGRPWGNHGPFLRYHIETATVRGINTFRQYKTDTTTIGRSATDVQASIQMIRKHLTFLYFLWGHFHSLKFYANKPVCPPHPQAPEGDIPEAEQPPGASAPVLLLMPSLSRFASSGYYMPAFGQLAVIMLLHVSIDLWDLGDSSFIESLFNQVVQLMSDYLFPKGDLDKRGGWLELAKRGGWVGILSPLSSSPGILSILTPVVISHMTGVALYTLPILSQQMAVQHFPVSETEIVVLTAIVIYTAYCFLAHSFIFLCNLYTATKCWRKGLL